ncbi:polysaccharide deacetylase family protein [Streptomyces caniscabiei]|uniref:Polysaccharide deacetylase family protein n=1 Tax=Streptomyces caniscabiei TaxID=2746961 RepID=A0A927QL02_9ACTN|nr:polysaccharide deacetylase family protein [Streptomyces caniscabiei]MBD9701233.1 polysaccharide deacetylase family protein [Streptomyces caniscabiei]MBD9724394.1 polysaccharide deacetylase family protein [Streptomyces caniscabiei]MDX3507802.1 polysaccharide deacetylase family protein [Streptomyces caniscabiei]MDX3717764.1 polysaccharide deacetylase family protein [Streptomyces caniscabiei]MDX3726589.1 polysaccharide deacetylase family protein [Streptomyces caniscabiei]
MQRRLVISTVTSALCATTLVGTATSASAAPQAVDCRKVKCVALTFDDGPVKDTQRLLGLLNDRNVRATFYAVGTNVQKNPATTRAASQAGHQIGNHSWDHANLTKLSAAKVKSQLSRTDTAIKQATGKKPTTFRAPYGAHNATVRSAAGRPLVHWSVDTLDWKYKDSARLVKYVNAETRPGDIILMHDIHRTTVDAVPGIIKALTARGFHFVTVDQLFAPTKLAAGKVTYHNRAAYRP